MTTPVTLLNNHLQLLGKVSALSWSEVSSGPPHEPVWTVVCNVEGEPKGTGVGAQKSQARQEAAAKALQALQGANST